MADPVKPETRLLEYAAILTRGLDLDERFELSEAIPKWALRNLAKIEFQHRKIADGIRYCCSQLITERLRMRAQLQELGQDVD